MNNILIFYTFEVYIEHNIGNYYFDRCYKSRDDAKLAYKYYSAIKDHYVGKIHYHKIDLSKNDLYNSQMAKTLEYYSNVYYESTGDILYV